MIFGVAAVVAMLSIGAGAQQEVMAFIEQLGVRNLIVEAREAGDGQALQKVRQLSAGLVVQGPARHPVESRQHHRGHGAQALHADEAAAAADRRRHAGGLRRQPRLQPPSANLRMASGRFFDEAETSSAAPVAVVGEAAAATLFGADDPVGKYVKVNEQWLQVDRRRRAAAHRAVRRRGAARAGSQQPGLRAALFVDLPARGRPELAQGRDRRHLHADEVERRRPVGRGARARHSRRRAPRRRRLHHRRRRRSCSRSSAARSGSSRW